MSKFPRRADFGEIMGLVVGGMAIGGALFAQVLFLSWII